MQRRNPAIPMIEKEICENVYELVENYKPQRERWDLLPMSQKVAIERAYFSSLQGEVLSAEMLEWVQTFPVVLDQLYRVDLLEEHSTNYTRSFRDDILGRNTT